MHCHIQRLDEGVGGKCFCLGCLLALFSVLLLLLKLLLSLFYKTEGS